MPVLKNLFTHNKRMPKQKSAGFTTCTMELTLYQSISYIFIPPQTLITWPVT